jgi:predicted enzyme related to lactoylglutathione lyase
MSDLNDKHNRLVWFDIPASDLKRAAGFYSAVMGIEVEETTYPGGSFYLLEHGEGNGGCIILDKDAIAGEGGILCYMNVSGRLRDAVRQTEIHGGKVLEPVHAIGPHGFRAIVIDSEGNRIALHSHADG